MSLLQDPEIALFLKAINNKNYSSDGTDISNPAYPLVEALVAKFVSKSALVDAADEYASEGELLSSANLLTCDDVTFYNENKDIILAFAEKIKGFGKGESMLEFIYNDMNVLEYNLVSLDTLAQAVYVPQTKPASELDMNDALDQSFLGLANWALSTCMLLTLQAYSTFKKLKTMKGK